MTADKVQYRPSDEVDFVIIGSGAAGGILAKELSTNGFRVVVLEQGPYLTESDFSHDEIKVLQEDLLTNHPKLQPNTFRKTPDEKAKPQRALVYGRAVGGTSWGLCWIQSGELTGSIGDAARWVGRQIRGRSSRTRSLSTVRPRVQPLRSETPWARANCHACIEEAPM